MSKKAKSILLGLLILCVVVGFTITSQNNTNQGDTSTQIVGQKEFVVGEGEGGESQANGMVVAKNSTIIYPSVGGVLQKFSCQLGDRIQSGQVVAVFLPASDMQTKNMEMQKSYLQQQLLLANTSLTDTLHSLDLQIQNINQQKSTNIQQKQLFLQNLQNLVTQKQLSNEDISVQRENLENQLATLKTQYQSDLEKTKTTQRNQIIAAKTNTNTALHFIYTNFGIGKDQSTNGMYIYIGALDDVNKQQIKNTYEYIENKINNLASVSAEQAAADTQEIVDYFSLATKVIISSIVDSRYLPQEKIDALSSSLTTMVNSILQIKGALDSANAGIVTMQSSYPTQITSMESQITSLQTTKTEANNRAMDSQINSLQSQINSLQLATDSFETQLAGLENTKKLQGEQMKAQRLSIEQNIETINNTLRGEVLTAPISGTVKSSSVVVGNKVFPGNPLCVIGPEETNELKIQFTSPKDISLQENVALYDGERFLGTGIVSNKTQSIDAMTQNRTYEIAQLQGTGLVEGKKVTIRFQNTTNTADITIPLSYIIPKLNGYFVKKLLLSGDSMAINGKDTQDGPLYKEYQVEVGEINGDMITILSGLQIGDRLVR